MSGGGSSGAVSFPTYLERQHGQFLTGAAGDAADLSPTVTLYDVYESATGVDGNPFDDLEYEDPALALGQASSRLNEFAGRLSSSSPTFNWNKHVTNAVAKVDQDGVLEDIDIGPIIAAAQTNSLALIKRAVETSVNAIDDDVIVEALESFRQRQAYTKNRSIRSFASQMGGLNATNSSAFILGMAMIETQAQMSVGEFHSQLALQQMNQNIPLVVEAYKDYLRVAIAAELANKEDRSRMILSGVDAMENTENMKLQLNHSMAAMYLEFNRIKIVAEAEYIGNVLDLNYRHANWEWEILLYSANFMGGLGHGTFVPKGVTKTASAIGGALSGAAAGAAMGSVVPGIGTAVGAGVGGLLGLASGIL